MPFDIFSEFDDDVVAVSEKWFRNNYGMVRGDQFPMTAKSTKFRWGDDDTDYVLNEVRAAINGEVYRQLRPFIPKMRAHQ